MDESKQGRKIIFRRSMFRAWLLACKDEIVGCTAEGETCPLSTWVGDVYGVVCVVGVDHCWIEGPRTPTGSVPFARDLPVWCKDFVRSLDFTYSFHKVTGAQALVVLDALPVIGQRPSSGVFYE